MLALHASQTLNGGQFYIGCAQLKITGSGSGTCGPQISIPGAYKADDKNIYIPNFYNGYDKSSFKAPGGEVATCGGAGGAAPSTPEPASSAVPLPTPSAVVEATPAPVASQAPAASAPASSPVASSVPAPVPGAGDGEALPKTFTVATFIAWLEGKAGSAASKARRHARAF